LKESLTVGQFTRPEHRIPRRLLLPYRRNLADYPRPCAA